MAWYRNRRHNSWIFWMYILPSLCWPVLTTLWPFMHILQKMTTQFKIAAVVLLHRYVFPPTLLLRFLWCLINTDQRNSVHLILLCNTEKHLLVWHVRSHFTSSRLFSSSHYSSCKLHPYLLRLRSFMIDCIVKWCNDNHLIANTSETKDNLPYVAHRCCCKPKAMCQLIDASVETYCFDTRTNLLHETSTTRE